MKKMAEAGVADPRRAQTLLEFWFGAPDDPARDRWRSVWFKTDPAFDAALCERFGADQERAAAGDYDGWIVAPDTALALVLLLDQLPRNLYRGTAAAYATDAKARQMARAALERGHDQVLAPVRRLFLYLPFEHSEDLADQALSVRLFEALPPVPGADEILWYVQRHYEIIARFGRFPHRNATLGRASTAAELDFLKEPRSGF
jgi:uncharacterized protein (DUF924 family)